MSDNELAVVEKPRELSVVEVKAQVAKVHTLMQELMQEGTHYGKSFPGDEKKNLLKPGADKLCFMFRLRPDFTQEIKNLPNDDMEVLTRCQIFHIESGQKIAEGVGFATTMESKYRWRNGTRKCPQCGKETIIKGKDEYGGGYICFAKKGGCGAKFKEDDPSIVNQVVGKIENPDIADTYNTVIKMSKKRAYVDATITACAASDIFSQDAEDFKDTAESLARQAEQEEPRNVTTEDESITSTPQQNALYQQCVDGMVELKNIMLATDGNTRLFTDDEYNIVKKKLEDITKLSDDERLAVINGLLNTWKEQLQIRLEKPTVTETVQPADPSVTKKGGKPSLKDEYRKVLAEKNGGVSTDTDDFTDDIPYEKEPAGELVVAGVADQLDIF